MVPITLPGFEDGRACLGESISASSAPAAEFEDGTRGLWQSTNSDSTPAGFMQFANGYPFKTLLDASTSVDRSSSSCGCDSSCFTFCEQFPNCTAGRTVFGNVSPFRSNSRGFQNINRRPQLTFISTPTVAYWLAQMRNALCPECTSLGLGRRTPSTLVKYNPELVGQALASF